MPNIFIDKLIADFSLDNLAAFFRNKISSFNSEKEDLRFLFDESKFEKYSSIDKIGEAEIDSDELIIICSKTTDPITERTGKKRQYDIAKKVLKQEVKDAAFFIFYDDKGNFRFSFVRANYLGNRRDFTDFKRYTYFVSPALTNNTFKRQIESCNFTTLDEIIEAFSVEPLNKQFYQEIAKAFYTLIGGTVKINSRNIEFSNEMQLPSTPIETNRKIYQEFAVRLIGRTIFCWFLKNKKSENEIPLVPESWLSSKAVERIIEEKNNYYHSILEKLFFLVLNRKISERAGFLLPDEHELIPFLNGGLFDPHINDFFIADQPNYALEIPSKWFLELFEVLEQFNFTIDENSIFDAEVSIDPEMLGTIFENLLAEIDPDTEKSARNATGSFYTPREIVDYMVEQSLIQYLKTKTGITDNDSLTQLFKEGGENNFELEDTETILKAISKVKILDPACGSGAFPMGAVSKIILALKKLDPGAKWWRDQQVNSVPNAIARKKLKEKLDAATSDYARKLGVIQNSIYGVDIQPIAAEISKLRSFLSLVIDENIDDNAVNRGIEPLPNLEFKFVTANTLIDLSEKVELKNQARIDFGDTESLQVKLQEIRNSYLQAYGEDKETLKKEFKDTQTEIYKHELSGSGGALNKRALQLAAWNPFGNESSEWFNPEWMFGVDKFDIVIGNPPYSIYQGKNKSLLKPIMKSKIYSKAKGGKINAYELFLCKIPVLLKEEGVNCQIFQNSFLGDNAATGIRKYYLKHQRIITIDSFPERDNPKKRVFEKVKMSVCILLNANFKDANYEFNVNFWDDKFKTSGKSIVYNNNSIIEFNKDQAIIYNLNDTEKSIFEKYFIQNKDKYSDYYDCLEGELNMTFHKRYLTNNTTQPLVVKGAQVQRYFLSSSPSQGVVEYVDKNRYLLDYKRSKKSQHHNKYRIAMQGITGANDKVRIVATLIPKGVFLANSCNYIITKELDLNYNIEFLLGLFNSKFTNWIFRISSTNSNVNCYEVNNLNLPSFNKLIFEKIKTLSIECSDKNGSSELESEIDFLVYKLYCLKYDEVKLIDPEFPLTEIEYENFNIE